jgi:MFS family permease
MTANAIAVAFALFCMSLSGNFWLTALSMGFLAIGLSMNFALANTIVQERAPSPLRGRISAVFGLSFFGLMPIAGLGVTGLSDLIGMRNALGIASICFGVGAFIVLSAAGRKVCDATNACDQETAAAPEPVVIP